MFDSLKNLANMGSMMTKAREFQDRMKRLQDEMALKRVSAEAGGGLVTATVSGRMELLRLRIDPTRFGLNSADSQVPMTPADFEMLEDLIVAAVSAAQAQAAHLVRDEMARLAAEMGLPPDMLPGMGT
jgi:nucleoid-associated protein EbfC